MEREVQKSFHHDYLGLLVSSEGIDLRLWSRETYCHMLWTVLITSFLRRRSEKDAVEAWSQLRDPFQRQVLPSVNCEVDWKSYEGLCDAVLIQDLRSDMAGN